MIALAYANAGQKGKARELLSDLLQRDARGEHVVEYRIAAVYDALGERDEAPRWLGNDVDDRNGLGSWLVWLTTILSGMPRKDPRFQEIQRRAAETSFAAGSTAHAARMYQLRKSSRTPSQLFRPT